MDSVLLKLEGLFAKLPALPVKLSTWFVKAAPYLVIISLIFSAIALAGLAGFATSGIGAAALGASLQLSPIYWVLFALQIGLSIAALPGLFKRAPSGWTFTFYVILLGFVSSLMMGASLNAIISVLIQLYIAFQIKKYYFGQAIVPPTAPATQNDPIPPSAGQL